MHKQINNKTFEGQTIYTGIDYHKKNWKVTIMSEEMEHKTFSQDVDSKLLVSYLKRNFPGATYRAVYEAGFSGFDSCRELGQLGVDCIVIHPADVPTSRKEKLLKTDKTDSRKLAKTLRSKQLRGIDIPTRQLEADRALLRQRFRMVKDVTRTKNRVKSLMFQFGIKIPEQFTDSQSRHWSNVYIQWLTKLSLKEPSLRQTLDNYLQIGQLQRKEVYNLTRQISSLATEDRYRSQYKLMRSIPGIGMITGMSFLVQLGPMSRFERQDELNSYLGLIPSMHGSGDKMQTGKLIKRGHKQLKILLIEASWQAIRSDPALMAKYTELIKRMHKNKAIIRIARKLLNRIRYVLINQQTYEKGVIQ